MLFSAKGLALLAGRKLLLADDSITIQKIVALTFADEGIQVVAVSDGAEAVAKLEEISPDIVLADVFMPGLTGYQVCEHIKQSEGLKHIKVMLLVGSFEPFDEAEARRVGADDILTKPFQSIRNLVDKVAALLGRQTAADQLEKTLSLDATLSRAPELAPVAATAEQSVAAVAAFGEERADDTTAGASAQEAGTRELSPPELVPPPEEPLSTAEMAITTADTRPLSPEILYRANQSTSWEGRTMETVSETETMHTNFASEASELSREPESLGDALLELDAFESAGFGTDDVVLDVDFDSPTPENIFSPWGNVKTAVGVAAPAFVPVFASEKSDPITPINLQTSELVAPGTAQEDAVMAAAGSTDTTESAPAQVSSPHVHQPEFVSEEPAALTRADAGVATMPAELIKLEQLSPEVVDAIARRVVAQLSEKAVQEIAWEVVPQLADLMIKRKLEERESGNK